MPGNTTDRQRFVVGGDRGEIDRVQQGILDALRRYGYDQAACFAVRTAMEEAVSNAVHHGNAGDLRRKITIEFAADESSVEIEIEDEGRGFEPGSVPDPTRPENVDIPSGRGIMLMKVYMNEVEFTARGNRVRMRYEKK
jgi:serine/threonine-protein kinase RsbW